MGPGPLCASVHDQLISVMELDIGIARKERQDLAQGRILRRWFDERVLEGFRGRILPIDLRVARRAAKLHVPDPAPERDALIAATALTHNLAVVTRNLADYKSTGVELINPWQA